MVDKLVRTVARPTRYGDLKIRPGDRDDDRHCLLIRPAKNPGHDGIWLFIGWCWGHDASRLGVWMPDLPRPAWKVERIPLHTPVELIADLDGDRDAA